MNDAERDAWLREALRHAPDSGALPPSGVSEAILLKARAAARATAPAARRAGSRDASANPLMALWDWLARPPIAAGFASVMAATLVGLMWWDRPMDDTMVRAPAPVSDRVEAAAPAVAERAAPPTGSMRPESPQPTSTSPGVTQSGSTSTSTVAPASGEARRRPAAAAEPGNKPDAKESVASPAAPPALKDDGSAAERKLQAKRKNEAPAPFPASEQQRETEKTTAADSPSREAAKKEADNDRLRAPAMTQPSSLPAPPSTVLEPAPAARPEATAAAKPAPVGAGAANRADAALAKSATAPAQAGAAAQEASPPPRDAIDAARDALTSPAERDRRQRALADSRDKDGSGFASPPPAAAPFRSELARSRPGTATRSDAAATKGAPLAAVIAAIAADPDRWSRQATAGDIQPLDVGWRRWLAELDAAASGRWRSSGPADASPGRDRSTSDRATTLRLAGPNRARAVIRIDGATVHVETAAESGAEHWLATLDPAATEALRAAARRLPP